ncbi:hypothetical protein D3C87_1594170 [compost metagenome]
MCCFFSHTYPHLVLLGLAGRTEGNVCGNEEKPDHGQLNIWEIAQLRQGSRILMVNVPSRIVAPQNGGCRMLLFHFSELTGKITRIVIDVCLLFKVVIGFCRVQALVADDIAFGVGHDHRQLGIGTDQVDQAGITVVIVHGKGLLSYFYV